MKARCQVFAATKNRIKTQLVSVDPGHNEALVDKARDSITLRGLLNKRQDAGKVTHYLF